MLFVSSNTSPSTCIISPYESLKQKSQELLPGLPLETPLMLYFTQPSCGDLHKTGIALILGF